MQNAISLPVGKDDDTKRPDDLNRLTDHLVARLRDVQAILADHQPQYEPKNETGF